MSDSATAPPAQTGQSEKRDRTHYLYIAVIVAVVLGIVVGFVVPESAWRSSRSAPGSSS